MPWARSFCPLQGVRGIAGGVKGMAGMREGNCLTLLKSSFAYIFQI